MLKLKRLVEQFDTEGQFYDLGQDFSGFKQSLDGSIEQLKQKFQLAIGEHLNGKRVIAKASRGYKQYVKDYEFDISKVTIDDYYDNYVVVAHDMSTGKQKEYFLKPGYKIKILGVATGQPSPQKGGKGPEPQSQPIPTPAVSHANTTVPNNPTNLKETGGDGTVVNKEHTAYSLDSIVEDISTWLPKLLKKPNTPMLDFVKAIGWTIKKEDGVFNSIYEIQIPTDALKFKIDQRSLSTALFMHNPTLHVISLDEDKKEKHWNVKIKKIYRK